MKSHLSALRLILTLLAFAMTAMAQTPVTPVTPVVTPPIPPASMPVGSYSQLKAYASEQVNFAQMDLWAATYQPVLAEPNVISGTRLEGESPFMFLERVLKHNFKFKLLDKRDQIHINGSAYSSNGDLLFWGNETGYVYDRWNGTYGFSISLLKLHLADLIPLPAGGITNAVIYYRDENGQFAWPLPLTIYEGKIYFPTKYAGQEGQLIATYKSASGYEQVAYDLSKDGQRVNPILVGNTVKGAIDNTFEFNLNTGMPVQYVVVDATAETGRETPPVVRIVVPDNGITYRMNVWSRISRYGRWIAAPDRAMIRREGTAFAGSEVALPVNDSGDIVFDVGPGVYWLMLDNDQVFSRLLPQPSPEDLSKGDDKG
jgi:hypothetical protein